MWSLTWSWLSSFVMSNKLLTLLFSIWHLNYIICKLLFEVFYGAAHVTEQKTPCLITKRDFMLLQTKRLQTIFKILKSISVVFLMCVCGISLLQFQKCQMYWQTYLDDVDFITVGWQHNIRLGYCKLTIISFRLKCYDWYGD